MSYFDTLVTIVTDVTLVTRCCGVTKALQSYLATKKPRRYKPSLYPPLMIPPQLIIYTLKNKEYYFIRFFGE